MCDQCMSDAVQLGEVVPGWVLFYTRKRGAFVGAGAYCLAPKSSDAVAVWPPEAFASDVPELKFITALTMSPEEGHALLEAAIAGGYDRTPTFADWLWQRCRALVLAHPAHRE